MTCGESNASINSCVFDFAMLSRLYLNLSSRLVDVYLEVQGDRKQFLNVFVPTIAMASVSLNSLCSMFSLSISILVDLLEQGATVPHVQWVNVKKGLEVWLFYLEQTACLRGMRQTP